MALKLAGYIDLPAHQGRGGFDHAALHAASGRLFVAHTANDALDVSIDASSIAGMRLDAAVPRLAALAKLRAIVFPWGQHEKKSLSSDIVVKLEKNFDAWWDEVRPCMENEEAYQIAPKINPFKEQYWKQFGGGPTPGATNAEPSRK